MQILHIRKSASPFYSISVFQRSVKYVFRRGYEKVEAIHELPRCLSSAGKQAKKVALSEILFRFVAEKLNDVWYNKARYTNALAVGGSI